jgi:hypothetical protein
MKPQDPAGRLSYVLPLRWERPFLYEDLTGYLSWLAGQAEVIVVDGSAEDVFAAHAAAWGSAVTHIRPDPRIVCRSGKVAGVLTGIARARLDVVVVADDDVRWPAGGLREAERLIERADLVVPQNYFDPSPWHARWDTARSLIARATGGDFPGTLVLRRATLARAGGYDGDALFENLELRRTVEAAGGRVYDAPGLFVRRLPPSSRHFVAQRVRQAYDEFARPGRLVAWLALLPSVALLTRGRPARIAAAAAATMAVAEAGRRRAAGTTVFPSSAALWAPLWTLERGVCIWVAFLQRLLLGGTPYAGHRLRLAANSRRAIAARLARGGYRALR